MYGKWLYKEIGTEYGACMVEIYRKNYTGESIEIGALAADSLSIALENLGSITDPIGKSVCSFSIIDTDQVEYDDFFTPDATALKVVVSTRVGSGAYATRWSGYVTPDFFAENLSYRTPISISARDNIGYLNDVDFDLTAATTITVRELIQSAFRKIAEDYPMSLSFVSQKQTAEGILAIDATISTTLLREMSWGEALETILHDLGLQMRWVDNNTIAVLDLSQIPEYYATQGFNFVDASGYREIVPAWRELSQEQNYGVRENFFEGWLREDNITFVKTENIRIPLSMGGVTGLVPMRYYTPNNWGVAGNTFVINPKDYVYFGTYGQMAQPFGERIFFTGVEKDATNIANNYMSYRQDVYASNRPMRITFKAFTSVMATGGIGNNDALLAYDPANRFMDFATGDTLQLGLKVNLLLHVGTRTYILGQNWEEINGAETNSLYFVLPKIGQVDGSSVTPNEEEITIDVNTIPNDGVLELRIYGFTIHNKTNLQEDAGSATYDWLRMVSYINEVKYTYNIDNPDTGRYSQVEVNKQHNIKDTQSYTFGQIPVEGGAVNAFAGGLFKADGNELIGFQRNADATNYNLLELVGRELIHFNKKNYNRLSGTIRNLDKEPLMFNRLFVREGKKYAPYNYSLNVISNEMNITSMQEVEQYETAVFNVIDSQITTGGGTVSGGNNTILQYSEEAGNEKRLYELQTATEQEKNDAFVLIDKAGFSEARKLHISDIAGLDRKALEQYLVEYKYLQEADLTPIIEDFEKLEEAVNPLFGYFDANGNANNALKLDGHSAEYFATADALNTHITAFNNYKTTTDDRLNKLEALWYMDGEGNVHTTHNIVVDKGGAFGMGAESGDVPSASVSIKFDGSNIVYSPVDGIITLPAYPSGGGGVADSVDWANVANKPTTLGGYGITDALSTSGGTISSSQPNPLVVNSTYANNQLVEIALSYNNTQKGFIGYYVDGAYIGDSVTGYRIGVRQDGEPVYKLSWSGVEHVLYHTGNFNPADYLPLNGGTIRAGIRDLLTLEDTNTDSDSRGAYITMRSGYSTNNYSAVGRNTSIGTFLENYQEGTLYSLHITNDGLLKFRNNQIVDASNISSYALPLSGGTIDGSIEIGKSDNTAYRYLRIIRSGSTVELSSSGGFGVLDIDGVGFVFNTTTAYWNGNTLIHSGNIGGQRVADANRLYSPSGLNYANADGSNVHFGYITSQAAINTYLEGYNLYLCYGASHTTGLLLSSSGNVLIGTTTDDNSAKLQVEGIINIKQDGYALFWGSNKQYRLGSNGNSDFYIFDDNTSSTAKLRFGTAGADRMNILPNGNVLIGTSTDWGYKLGVYGATFITGNADHGILIGAGNNTIDAWRVNGNSTNLFLNWQSSGHIVMGIGGGNTLIGTDINEGYKLDVNGSMQLRAGDYIANRATLILNSNSGNAADIIFKVNSTTKGNYGWWAISSRNDSTGRFSIWRGGENGINPSEAEVFIIDAYGNLTISGGGAFGSDIRYKDIISYRQLDLETIVNAPLFSFRWTDREDKVEHLGTSAQYWLGTRFKDAVNITNPKFFHLDYGALAVGIGISVAREVKGVKTEVQTLKEELSQVKKELKYYKELWQHSGHILHQHS